MNKHSYVGQRCYARIMQLKTLDRLEIEKIVTEEVAKSLGLWEREEKPSLLVYNNLMWSDSIGENLTFDEAKEYAKKCRDGGYDDWRVPTAKELADTVDWDTGKCAVGVGSNGNYWSSTQYSGTSGRSLGFNSGSSCMFNATKPLGFSVRCVRDLKTERAVNNL